MNIKHYLFLSPILALTFSLNTNVIANDKIGNGGDIINCSNKPPVILDYYEAGLKKVGGEIPQVLAVGKMTQEKVIEKIMKRLEAFPSFHQEMENALKTVGNVSEWIESESTVQELADSKEAYNLPPSCKLTQAAVRQDQTIYVSPDAVEKVSAGQLGVLALHEAIYYLGAEKGHTNSIKARNLLANLLKENSNDKKIEELVNDFYSKKSLLDSPKCEMENFFLAAEDGNLSYIKMCLDDGIYIDSRRSLVVTPLLIAARKNHLDIVKYLVYKGANVNISYVDGSYQTHTAIKSAVGNSNLEMAKILVEGGADLSGNLVKLATSNKDLPMVKYLVEKNAPLGNAFDKAIDLNYLELVKYFAYLNDKLLDVADLDTAAKADMSTLEILLNTKRAPVNQPLNDGSTVISTAVKYGKKKNVELLLKNGAYPNYQDNNGNTPLFKTYEASEVDPDRIEIAKLLLDNGAIINLTNNNNETALMVAARHLNRKKIQLFLKYGAFIEMADKDGLTPLFHAVEYADRDTVVADLIETIKLLIANGANVKHLNAKGESIIKFLENCSMYREDKLAIYEYLKSVGAQ